jgi:glucosamine-6-phosphate deaminase
MPGPEEQSELMRCSVEALRARARLPFRLVASVPLVIRDFAESLADAIQARNALGLPTRLILPVGPIAPYEILVELTNRHRISWRNVHIFQMDEWLDWQGRLIAEDHPLSFRGFLRRMVIERIDEELRMPPDQFHFPHPFSPDSMQARMDSVGGVDFCYGGIGYHGHVAFNDPPISRWHTMSVDALRESRTRVVTLGGDSIVVQSIGCAGGDPESIPPMAVTLGMREILAARKIRLYCAGGERHRAVFRRAVAGEVTVAYPATLVQGHPDAEVITDEATAAPIALGLR